METPAPPGSGEQQAEGQQTPAPTSLAGRGLDDAICKICREYLTAPVTIECGHNFCQGCITQRCARAETASCPQCGETCQERAFRPNTQLGSLVQFIKHLGPKPGRSIRKGDVCAEHGKALGWFCKEDGKALCEDCRGSLAHHTHTVIPMGRAAQEPKDEASPSHRSDDGTAQAQEAISTQQEEPRAMASAHPLRKLLEEAICPICGKYFKDPVSMDCGHSFCCVCVTEHCDKMQTREVGVFCPQCRRCELKKEKFQINRQLARMVGNIQQLGINPECLKQQTVDGEHENKLKLFCEDDGEVICLVSDKTKEHRSHRLVPMEEAAQKYKAKLCTEIELLKKARKEISKLQSKEHNKSKDRKCQREQILSEFEKMHRLLREEEQLLPQKLVEEERETLQRLQENVPKLSQQSTSLQQMIMEIEKKCQQPAIELLQGVKGTLARSEQARRQDPELSAAELKAAYRVPGMLEMLREFTVDVTLDPDTANPHLILSEDRKRVRRGDTRQDLPDKPERFDPCTFVLGTEGFRVRKCYWEVEVGDKAEWVLGVCRESVSRKEKTRLIPENGYWVMGLKRGEYKALSKSQNTLMVSTRPSRVGVFLDYEAGEVSFYNVTDKSHLFTFTGTFSGTLRPFFCPGPNDDGTNGAPLTICPVSA